MTLYFISDLHLSDKRPDLIRAFVRMTQELTIKKEASTLYILGDFYEAWIGDDFQAPWNDDIEKALLELSSTGTNLFFLHGNRDFLIGHDWLTRVGASLIQEQTLLPTKARSVLLTHGDEYCLEDVEYQKFRQTVRSAAWQEHILALPLEQRIALAAQLRNDSKSMATEKSMDIMDVTQTAVNDSLTQHACQTVIHGHTHRPNIHRTENTLRCVLGDWDDSIYLAKIEENHYYQFKTSVESFNQGGLSSLEMIHNERLL